jgi:flagellar assembly protein FliH
MMTSLIDPGLGGFSPLVPLRCVTGEGEGGAADTIAWPALDQGASPSGADPASVLDEAYAAGYAAGLARGRAESQAAVEPALRALQEATLAVKDARTSLVHDTASDLAGIALAAAHHLVQREIQSDPSALRRLISAAIDLLPEDTVFTLHVHAEDLAQINHHADPLVPPGRNVRIQWISASDLERGSFRLETPHRLVDGRIDTALRALYERMAYE